MIFEIIPGDIVHILIILDAFDENSKVYVHRVRFLIIYIYFSPLEPTFFIVLLPIL